MALTKNRPPCPNCEGGRQHSLTSGWANDQTIPITYVKCDDCGYLGYQATVWLPEGTSLNRLDEGRRAYLRLYRRQQRGAFASLRPVKPRGSRRIDSDRLDINIRIIAGRVQAGLAKRLPKLTQKRSTVIEDEVAS